MPAKLYGVGVGPGDPMLMTYKAVEVIKRCPVIAIPGTAKENTLSFQIARQMIENIEDKEILCLNCPMTKDLEILEKSYSEASEIIISYLSKGKDVAFLTIGDPTVYSTYIYIHRYINNIGYETEIINGVPSFCASAALINDSLADRAEQIHIIPSSYDLENIFSLNGTIILMKTGHKIEQLKKYIQFSNRKAILIENAGLADEKLYFDVNDFPDQVSYFSTIILKQRG